MRMGSIADSSSDISKFRGVTSISTSVGDVVLEDTLLIDESITAAGADTTAVTLVTEDEVGFGCDTFRTDDALLVIVGCAS